MAGRGERGAQAPWWLAARVTRQGQLDQAGCQNLGGRVDFEDNLYSRTAGERLDPASSVEIYFPGASYPSSNSHESY